VSEGKLGKKLREILLKEGKDPRFDRRQIDDVLEEFYAEIPKALIYGTQEHEMNGYDHDDVWIMMDKIQEWFGPFVPAKERGKQK
jgi:hypothetical protein